MTALRLPCLLVFTFFTASGYAAPSLEAYGMLPQVSQMVVSPSGDLIAYRNTEADDSDYIVIYSLKDQDYVNLFRVDQIDPRYMEFSGDDHLLLVVSEHVDSRRFVHSFDAGTAFSYDIANNRVTPLVTLGEELSRGRVVYPGQSIGNIIGSSDDGEHVFIGAYVGDSITDGSPRYSMLSVPIDGEKRPRIAVAGNEFVTDYFLDADKNPIARIERNERNNTHTVRAYDGKDWNKIYEYEAELATHGFRGLTSDYKSLVFLRSDEDVLQYYTLSLADGAVDDLDGPGIENSIARMLYDDQQVVIGVQYSGFSPTYRMFDADLDQRVQDLLALFPGHSVYLRSWSPDMDHILVLVEGPEFAGDYILASKGQKPAWITAQRPGIAPEDINPQSTIEIPARDGLALPTILTLPRAKADSLDNLPTVMLPHGGPAAHDMLGFDYMAQAFASRGYLVVQPQFRGSSGFGKTLLTAGYGEWGRKMQDDLTDVLNALVAEGVADPERICIVGASYGGYAALAGAAFTPDLYACALSIAGISHLPEMLKEDKSRYGKNSDVLRYLERSILDDKLDTDALEAISPYFSADKVTIPILLMHGEDDTIVDFGQSKMMHRALEKAGKDVELVRLENEDHYLREGSTRLQALQVMLEFVDEHIGEGR
jgi:dipeptidyl aminopeptidase/acylaminoacyl peptidase